MSIRHEDRYPSAQTVSFQNEIPRLPSQNAERATVEGKVHSRVLLVEDEPLLRKVISRQLVSAGYVVRVAVDGLDAIGKLRAGPLDWIISDFEMPRMAGLEFLDVVRERFPQIRVILISGVSVDELPQGVASDAFCPKNEFISEQLLQTMSHLTRKPHPRTAPPLVDNGPVQARSDGNGRYIVRCEECFREFRVPSVFGMERDGEQTTCVHCASFVHFITAEDSEAS
jgi:CheY-like chemotaxis protein